jgi:hypothetical protein
MDSCAGQIAPLQGSTGINRIELSVKAAKVNGPVAADGG